MDYLDVFFEIHKDNPREGPGDDGSTAKAYSFLDGLPENPNIIDIGCGPGMQTIQLAKLSGGNITAFDFHQPFLDQIHARISGGELETKVKTYKGNMNELPFQKESFDLIWSEGAVYIMGFKSGINYWKDFIKSHGYIVVSEITWLKNSPPDELKEFWETAYSEMMPISEKIKIIEDAGLLCSGHFVLPEESWWNSYYNPINEKIPSLKEKYKDDSDALKVIEEEIYEQELFKKYSGYYNYVFYIMQKI